MAKLKKSKQSKTAPTYPVVLQPIASLVGSTLFFCLTSFVLPAFAMLGVGDIGDSAYINKPDLLLKDQMRASYIIGCISALYVVAQLCMVVYFTKTVTTKHKVYTCTIIVLLSLVFAYTISANLLNDLRP